MTFRLRRGAVNPFLSSVGWLRRSVYGVAVAVCGASPAFAAPTPVWSGVFASGLAGTPDGFGQAEGRALLAFTTPSGPRMYVGGVFSSAGGVSSPNLAAWDGRAFSPVAGAGVGPGGPGGSVESLTVFPIAGAARVVAAGFFRAPGTNDGLGFVDGSAIAALPPGPQSPWAWFGSAYAWTPPGSSPELLLSSGLFPAGSEYVYRLTSSGYSGVSPGIVSVASAYAEFDDGSGRALYINMNPAGSTFVESISRWDGTSLSPVASGLGFVTAMAVHDDGSGPALYAAGLTGLRRLRAGGVWESVPGAPSGGINALESFDDGTGPALYAAGPLLQPSGAPADSVIRLRGATWEPVGSGVIDGEVRDMAVFDEDGPRPIRPALYLTGNFTTVGGQPSRGVARWGVPPCRGDFDNSGATTPSDIFAFLSAFFARDARADVDGSGTFTPADIFGFLGAYFEGCATPA